MAKNKISPNEQDGSTAALAGSAATEPVAHEEAQPARGGSYTRNADGTLTQTEGQGFAQDSE